jgi:Fe-S-cluster containining protein
VTDGAAGVAAEHELPAGSFPAWLSEMTRALRGEVSADVPCGTCSACCTSSQFVHITPDETDTLAHVPAALRFPAPGLPAGHVVLGYDDRGHCPMLVDGRCSIYDHRPRACRTYDCRVFAAADVEPDAEAIAARVRQWRFSYPTPDDRARHEAVRAAAARLRAGDEPRAPDVAPRNATELALRALGEVVTPDRP